MKTIENSSFKKQDFWKRKRKEKLWLLKPLELKPNKNE